MRHYGGIVMKTGCWSRPWAGQENLLLPGGLNMKEGFKIVKPYCVYKIT